MDDLIAFLNARLGEDEAAANSLFFAARIPDKRPDFTACGGPAAEVYWDHFNPARVLREVAAKRAILAEYERVAGSAQAYPNNATITSLGAAQTVVKALGTVYSDHPDYRGEWAP